MQCKRGISQQQPSYPVTYSHENRMLGLVLMGNSFQFIGKNYLLTHVTAMGTKMAGSLRQHLHGFHRNTNSKQRVASNRSNRNAPSTIYSLCGITTCRKIEQFIDRSANYVFTPTIKFMRLKSQTNKPHFWTLLTKVNASSTNLPWMCAPILSRLKHFKWCTHFSSCHPTGVTKGFIKGEP